MNETTKIRGMFDDIVGSYDFLNHFFSFFQDIYWRKVMADETLPIENGIILDLATGTGDSAQALLERGNSVVGADISFGMLSQARKKIADCNYAVLSASAYELPFRDSCFDGVTCAFGIRNMHETGFALREIRRVLKSGGKAVFLEFSMPRGLFRIPYTFYLKQVMPAVAGFFSKKEAYRYLNDSIEKFPSPDEFADLIMASGFSGCDRRKLSFGTVFVHRAHKL